MHRLLSTSVILFGCFLGVGTAKDDGPYLGLRFIEIGGGKAPGKQVRVTYVDPRGLASQMGLLENDTFVTIQRKKISSTAEAKAALQQIQKKDGTRFVFEVVRARSGGRTSGRVTDDLRKLLGEVWKEDPAKKREIMKLLGEVGKEGGPATMRITPLQGVIRKSKKRPGSFYAVQDLPTNRPGKDSPAREK
jgi:hypothetical protein